MKELIREYEKSCALARERIGELTDEYNQLRKNGGETEIERRNLKQRIALLYTEHREMREVIMHLSSYMREASRCVKT